MGKYQAYPEYKDSGVEWIGLIPSTWEVKPLFSVAVSVSQKNDDGAEVNVLSLSYGRIVRRQIEDNYGLLPESFNTYQIVNEGDLILRLTDLQNDKRSLRVGYCNETGIITSAYLKLTARQSIATARFLYYLLHSYDTTKVFYGMGGGLRQSMKFEDMKRLQLLLPSISEQQKIAAFLDHETAKIDALIEKQQLLIQLLKEKRQAVISHAVTKGLNPNAPMKDSGIEWLGEVPAHWSLSEIRYVTSQIGGGTPSKDRVDFWNGNIPWVSPKDMKVDYIQTAQDKITPQAIRESSAKLVPEGCVLIVVRGMILAHSVPVALTLKSLTINQDVKALVPSKKVDGEFLLFLIKGLSNLILNQVEESAHGTKCLRTDVFERMKICIPDVNEQCVIVTQLKDRLEAIDLMLGRAAASMELLIERRTALISAAVTGKIDVRHFSEPATR